MKKRVERIVWHPRFHDGCLVGMGIGIGVCMVGFFWTGIVLLFGSFGAVTLPPGYPRDASRK